MNIYCLKDRQIDYYMQPFAGFSDQAVMAALSNTINKGEPTDAIAQAPQDFQLWLICEIDLQGEVKIHRRLICECASLIRRSVRPEPSTRDTSPNQQTPNATRSNTSPSNSSTPRGRTLEPFTPTTMGSETSSPDPSHGQTR